MKGNVGGGGLAYYDNVKELFYNSNNTNLQPHLAHNQPDLGKLEEAKRYAEDLQTQIRQKNESNLLHSKHKHVHFDESQDFEHSFGNTLMPVGNRARNNSSQQPPKNTYESIPSSASLPSNTPIPTINQSEVKKQRLADAMAGSGQGLVFGRGYGGGSGPLRDANGNVITDLNALKRYPSDAARAPPPSAEVIHHQTPSTSKKSTTDVYRVSGDNINTRPTQDDVPQGHLEPQIALPSNPKPIRIVDDRQSEVAERQRQQLAFRAALEEQIQDRKRRKEEEIIREREQALIEEARLQEERDRLRQQFEEERTARNAAVKAQDTYNQNSKHNKTINTMESDGVVIKSKPRPQKQREPPPPPLDNSHQDGKDTPANGSESRDLNPNNQTLAASLHSSVPSTLNTAADTVIHEPAPVPLTTLTTSRRHSHIVEQHQEIEHVRTALQEQLTEIRQLKEQAFESERRSIAVLRDLMDLTRTRLVAALGSQEVAPAAAAAALGHALQPVPSSFMRLGSGMGGSYGTIYQSEGFLSGAPGVHSSGLGSGAISMMQSSRLPILVTAATLQLEDSRPSSSNATTGVRMHTPSNTRPLHQYHYQQQQQENRQSSSGALPVLHTMASRLRYTTQEEPSPIINVSTRGLGNSVVNSQQQRVVTGSQLSHGQQQVPTKYINTTSTGAAISTEVDTPGSFDQNRVANTTLQEYKEEEMQTDASNEIRTCGTSTEKQQQEEMLSKKSRWRGGRLWPFSRVEKSNDGLWAWDDKTHRPPTKEQYN